MGEATILDEYRKGMSLDDALAMLASWADAVVDGRAVEEIEQDSVARMNTDALGALGMGLGIA